MTDHGQPALEIRTATRSDALAIGELNRAGWESAYATIVPARVMDDRRSSGEDPERWWRVLSSPGRANRVAVAGGALVGYSSWAPCEAGDGDPTRCGELVAMYVHPQRWRRGVGRALLGDVVDATRSSGREELVVWVLEKNTRARRFYEAMGCRLEAARRTVPKLRDPTIGELRYRKRL
jgi:GNAT superfamily N-acetyltransferase